MFVCRKAQLFIQRARWCRVNAAWACPGLLPGFWPQSSPRWWFLLLRRKCRDALSWTCCLLGWWLSDCSYIIVSNCSKCNSISNVSDLSFDQADLILVLHAGPLTIGVSSVFQSSHEAFYLCVCELCHLLTCCRCWRSLGKYLSSGTRSLGSDGESVACGCISCGIRSALVWALLNIDVIDISEQNVWSERVSDETNSEHNRNCCNR